MFFFVRRGSCAGAGVLSGSPDLGHYTCPDVKDPFEQLAKDITVSLYGRDLELVRTSDADDAIRSAQQRRRTQNGPYGNFVAGDFRNVFRPSRLHFVFIEHCTGYHRSGDIRYCVAGWSGRSGVWLLTRRRGYGCRRRRGWGDQSRRAGKWWCGLYFTEGLFF